MTRPRKVVKTNTYLNISLSKSSFEVGVNVFFSQHINKQYV